MCGIIGYVGKNDCVDFLIRSLKQLEYRGYDSSGIALVDDNGELIVRKKKGRIEELEKCAKDCHGKTGIGHTRWATHGEPSDVNSHPLVSGKFAVVHNGIIENYDKLKKQLINEGYTFQSATDTEVISALLDKNYNGDLMQTLYETIKELEGSYAIAVAVKGKNGVLAVARKNNPLIIGVGEEENFVASDIPGISGVTKKIYVMQDNDIALITAYDIIFFDEYFRPVERVATTIELEKDTLDKGDNDSYMLKEIREIPKAVLDTINNYLYNKDLTSFKEKLREIKRITIIGCGTAYHAGLIARKVIEKLAKVKVSVEVASEFRYGEPIISKEDLVIAVTQSGETADTIAGAKLAKTLGATLVVITNVSTSSIVNIADFVFNTLAGVEVSVPATKSYNAQLVMFYLLAVTIAEVKRKIEKKFYLDEIKRLPEILKKQIEMSYCLEEKAKFYSLHENIFFIGRQSDFATSLEASLKLKEISYIHSEGCPAGELKHGTLALIQKNTLVVAIATNKKLLSKLMNGVFEVKARGAKVLLISNCEEIECDDDCVCLEKTIELFMPIVSIIPLQLFSYYMALEKGNDPDRPRNLAKSVTVE